MKNDLSPESRQLQSEIYRLFEHNCIEHVEAIYRLAASKQTLPTMPRPRPGWSSRLSVLRAIILQFEVSSDLTWLHESISTNGTLGIQYKYIAELSGVKLSAVAPALRDLERADLIFRARYAPWPLRRETGTLLCIRLRSRVLLEHLSEVLKASSIRPE